MTTPRTRTGHRSLLSRAPVLQPNETHEALLQLSPDELRDLQQVTKDDTAQGALLRVQIATVAENVLRGRWTLKGRGR